MKTTHLVKILKTLDSKELKGFEEWTNSPFFNKNEKLKHLCGLILGFAPTFEHKDFTKQKMYVTVFKQKKYNATQLNNVISDLLQLLFKYLAYQNFQQTSEFEKICLMNELFAKGAHDSMLKVGRKFRKAKQEKKVRNSSYFFDNYLHHKQMDEYSLTQPERGFNESLQLKNDELDLFYVATKLKIASDMASRNLVIQSNYIPHFVSEIIDRIETNTEKYDYPAIMVYYNVLQTMKNGEPSFYFQLKTLLAENLTTFPKDELRILYDYARNYCIRKINEGEDEYYQEILNLYQFLLDKKIIFKNGYLTQWDYKNIITVGVRLKEFDWTEQFIEQYKNQLPPSEQENAYVYNLAAYHYERGNYKKSLMLLHEVRFTDASYYIGAKIIQLKSYYELEESEAFFALVDAFKIYILRDKKLSDYRRKANLNFLKLATKIYKIREDGFLLEKTVRTEKIKTLHSLVQKTTPLMNKSWLEEVLTAEF